MSAAPGDTVTYSRPSLTQTTTNMPKGSSGSAATLIRTTPILRHSLRPCTASQRSGAAGHRPVSGRDPGSSAEGYGGARIEYCLDSSKADLLHMRARRALCALLQEP